MTGRGPEEREGEIERGREGERGRESKRERESEKKETLIPIGPQDMESLKNENAVIILIRYKVFFLNIFLLK